MSTTCTTPNFIIAALSATSLRLDVTGSTSISTKITTALPWTAFGRIPEAITPNWGPALDVHENALTLQEVEYPFVLDLRRSTMGALGSMLPLADPSKQWLYKPLMALSTMALGGMYFHWPNPY